MFLIASSGRCGTLAVCHGLSSYSDHHVLHEPQPCLLEEAHRKHTGANYRTATIDARIEGFQQRANQKYGESFRAPNLLEDIADAVPGLRVLVLVRDPLEYIVSAHFMRVFRKDDVWDRTRLVPLERSAGFDSLPLAEKLCWHWVAVNRYILDFVESKKVPSELVIVKHLGDQIGQMADFLRIAITDRPSLTNFLSSRPNASAARDLPAGYSPEVLRNIYAREWERARSLAPSS
jgi:hypothetical protein